MKHRPELDSEYSPTAAERERQRAAQRPAPTAPTAEPIADAAELARQVKLLSRALDARRPRRQRRRG